MVRMKKVPRFTVIRGTYVVNIPELAIYSNLKHHGFDPELLAARKTAFTDDEVDMPVRRLPTPTLAGPLSRTLSGGYLLGRVSQYRYYHEYLRGFDSAVKDSDILCPVDLGHPTSYQCLRHQPRAKVVVQVWDNIPFNWLDHRPIAQHYNAVLEKADFFIPLTLDADRTLRLQGVKENRRAQVYPGIDTEAFRPPSSKEREDARKKLGVGKDEVAIAFVGRIEFHKGIFTLIESLVETDKRVHLYIFGAGGDRALAETRARKLGVADRVRFCGSVPHKDIQPRVLWAVDALTLPSIPTQAWREQFGQVLIEAMSTGLPVISSLSGAIPEVVENGRSGFLVVPDSPSELTDSMNRLANDRSLRQKMGEEGRARVLKLFDAKVNSALLAKILHRVVEGS
jgi:glycosyltransferase involved in cell wall biosynthesis